MAENLFKDSNPDCNVASVPVVDFRFVEDCFITPTPPPLFECVQPAVPATPCVPCPELNTTATLKTGFAGDEEGCVNTPKIVFTTTKTQDDPCTFDLDLDIELPFPKIPCPEINVKDFGVSSRYVNDGGGGICGGEEFECPGGNNSYFAVSTRHIPGDCQTADQCIFDLALVIDVPIPTPPCPDIKSKYKQNIGYADSPCVSCTSDTVAQRQTALNDLPVKFKKEGVYASVTEAVSAYSLQSDLKTWEPAEFSRTMRSVNELSAISLQERGGTTFIISQPPRLYRATNSGGWDAINTPNIDYSVATAADRDALNLSSDPADTVVFVAADDAFWRKTETGWVDVTPPEPDITIEKTSELSGLSSNPGTVVGIQNPTNRYKYVNNLLTPDEDAPEIMVYDEESLTLVRQEERCVGLLVGVMKPTNRYKFSGGEWRPARCPDSGIVVLSRKAKPKDCETPPQCILDVVSELTVPIPRPPCPEFNVENFRVTTSFTGDTLVGTDDEQNAEDDSCSGCATVLTAATYADALVLVAEQSPPLNTTIKITNPPQFYALADDLTTWLPTESTATNFNTIDDFEQALDAGDIAPGTVAAITQPDTLYILGTDLKTTTPVRTAVNPPPGRLVTLLTLASLPALPFEVRFSGLYIRILEPVSSVISQDGLTWTPATDALVVNNEYGLQRIDPEDRVAGMVVRVLNPSERFKVTADGLAPVPCPQNRLTITPTVKKTNDCETPNTCEFAVELEIDVPVPRIPCPIINVKDFSVNTRFSGGGGDNNETCCAPDAVITVIAVSAPAELNGLNAPIDSYAQTSSDGRFWLKVQEPPATIYPPTAEPVGWIETTDPNASNCQNLFRIIPKHRPPKDCHDPGQCEFDIELKVDVPIPRPPCPTFTAQVNTTVGFADSSCVACIADIEVSKISDVDTEELEPGTYIKITTLITQYKLQSDGTWLGITAIDDTTAAKTVDSWADVTTADQVNNNVIEVKTPPKYYAPAGLPITIPLSGDGSGPQQYTLCWSWEPLTTTVPGQSVLKTFSSLDARDAYFNNPNNPDYLGFDPVIPIHTNWFVEITNPPSKFKYLMQTACGVPGWVANGSGDTKPATKVVRTEEDLLKLDVTTLEVGTIVTVANPTDRYVIDDAGKAVPAPCPKNNFAIFDTSSPPSGCDDPGQCSFGVLLDILVPIPRVPCPEINITDFGVNTRNVGPCGDPCKYDITVETANDLNSIPQSALKKGLRAYTSKEEQIWQWLESGSWELIVENAKICKNSFTISARKECSDIAATVKDVAARDELVVPDDVEAGQIVVTLEPTKKAWRAGDGIKTAAWTETKVPEKCEDANKACQCIFDVELLISVPIPVPPCPKFNVTRFEVKSYYDREECCENESNRTCDPNDTVNNPDECVSSYFKICAAESGDGCNTECIFDIELVIAVPIPPPFCPVFSSSVSVTAGYKTKSGESCVDCPADREVTDLSQITDPWPGMTVKVTGGGDGGGARYRWTPSGQITVVNGTLQQGGSWRSAECQSSFMIVPGGRTDCDEQVCTFAMILDLVVELPLPPCPEFKIRNKNFDTCNYDYPYFRFVIEPDEQDNCPDDEESNCKFNIDIDLFIPCPLFTDAGITVTSTDDLPPGGMFNVNKICEPVGGGEDFGSGVCNFLFAAEIIIPKICKPAFRHDETGITGIPPEDRVKIWYIKPGQMCPADVQFFRQCYQPMCRTAPWVFTCATGRNRVIIRQDCQDPCLYWYAVQTLVCHEMPYFSKSDPVTAPDCAEGYTPLESLEIDVEEDFPGDRTSPPTYKFKVDATTNCLKGGTITISGGACGDDSGGGPFYKYMPGGNPANAYCAVPNQEENYHNDNTPLAGPFNSMEECMGGGSGGGGGGGGGGALGTGRIWIENNTINAEITLCTKSCDDAASGGGGSSGGGSYPFTARPETIPPETLSMAAASPGELTNKVASSGLISTLISAIKTDPQLRAAIREIVNQPD